MAQRNNGCTDRRPGFGVGRALRVAAEAEDAAAGWGAEQLRAGGVPVDYLLAMKLALNLWVWKTSEAMKILVRPATEDSGHCRFIDLLVVFL